MSHLNKAHERVSQHYNDSIFEFESVRLSQYSPVDAITARYLNRWIPDGATVANIGVGVGHYAELLAKRGCSLYLIDISQRLLEATYTRLEHLKLDKQVLCVSTIFIYANSYG